MDCTIGTYLDYFKNTENRNELFPFFIGILIVAGGSSSTILYFFAGFYVIFLNPNIGFKQLSLHTMGLYKKKPVLLIFPLFVFSLLLFSAGRANFNKLLETIASHFQLLLIVPMAVGLLAISQNKNCVRYFINGLQVGILIIFPIAILQIVNFSTRPEGFSGNSLIFGFIMALAGALCLLQDNDQQQTQKFRNYIPTICAFIMVIISFSRAPILVALLLVAFSLLLAVKKYMSLKQFWSAILLSIAGITLGVVSIAQTDFGARYFDKRIVEPVTSIFDGELIDNSIRKRIDLNYSGLHAFVRQPLTGYGLQNTVEAANSVSEQVIGKNTNYKFSHLHNEYLTYAVAGGIFLLLQYLIIIAAPIIIQRKQQRDNAYTYIQHFTLISSLGFATIALTNVVLAHDIMSTFFSMCMILVLINCIQTENCLCR